MGETYETSNVRIPICRWCHSKLLDYWYTCRIFWYRWIEIKLVVARMESNCLIWGYVSFFLFEKIIKRINFILVYLYIFILCVNNKVWILLFYILYYYFLSYIYILYYNIIILYYYFILFDILNWIFFHNVQAKIGEMKWYVDLRLYNLILLTFTID